MTETMRPADELLAALRAAVQTFEEQDGLVGHDEALERTLDVFIGSIVVAARVADGNAVRSPDSHGRRINADALRGASTAVRAQWMPSTTGPVREDSFFSRFQK